MTAPVRKRLNPPKTVDVQTPPWEDEPEAAVAATEPSPEVKSAEGTIYVHRAHYRGRDKLSEQEARETIRVPVFATTPAMIEVEGSVTRNQGDFNSCRVAAKITMPAYPEWSEVERVYRAVSTAVDRLVTREVSIATGLDYDDSQPILGDLE